MSIAASEPPPCDAPREEEGAGGRPPPGRGSFLLTRALRPITEVHAEELATALLMTVTVFVLMAAYSIMKPVRDGMILELPAGAEYKSYMSGATAIALLVLVPVYSRLDEHFQRDRLLTGVTLFFALQLILFHALSQVPALRGPLGLLFYVWLGVFGMMGVAQFWAFANDIYSEKAGKRLFPLFGLGASLGAVAGSKVSAMLVYAVGRYAILLVSAALLFGCAALFRVVHQRAPGHGNPASSRSHGRRRHAFGMVLEHRYLRLLALFSILFTVVNSNGEYLLGRLIKEDAAAAVAGGLLSPSVMGDHLSAQFASFYLHVNLLGLGLQAFVVSRLVKYAGLKGTFLLLPCVALVGGIGFSVLPVLALLRVTKVAENAADYSVNNTARHLLWLPTTREMKYRAKQAVDTFCVRLGDVSSALIVMVGTTFLALPARGFALLNVAFVLIWFVAARAILTENARLREKMKSLHAAEAGSSAEP